MVESWYDDTIQKIRFTADPGGEALTIDEAEDRVKELSKAINRAREHQ